MKILIVCERIPFSSMTDALSFRILHSVKYLHEKHGHKITIAGFREENDPDTILREYTDKIISIELPTSLKKRILYYLFNYTTRFFLEHFLEGSIFDFNFSWKLHEKINDVLSENYDVIFVAQPSMLPYVAKVSSPKVLETWRISQIYYEYYKSADNLLSRLYGFLGYLKMKRYEKKYENFDVCIVPTKEEGDELRLKFPDLKISVVSFGVDTVSKPRDLEEDYPSILFFGNMSSMYNEKAALFLYNNIYPLIKEEIPDTKLYIVGRSPSKKICNLKSDDSVIVTGYVRDLRYYLARSTVVTLPLHGFGIKTRILEAMAMGKPVVTSSEGVHGIEVDPWKNIIIEDDPEKFAKRVITLLNNKELRNDLGSSAKRLIRKKYSWEIMADKLNNVLEGVAKDNEV